MVEIIESLTIENGQYLSPVPVAYKTWGRLNAQCDNAILVCHAFTGSADLADWWGPLVGTGCALDTDRYFIISSNVLGSCYGTMGPASNNPVTGDVYGPDFPQFTIRDTVALQRALLDRLGIKCLVAVIGGSLGGMQVLEWAFQGNFARRLIPIATGGRHSAWCIGWSEVQRQAICNDPNWAGGRYYRNGHPRVGLAQARQLAMLTYRSRGSFERRFGRQKMNGSMSPFAISSYLEHQGIKLVERFDANSYIRLTEAMDTHDLARERGEYFSVLRSITQPALVIGVDSDLLYPVAEQEELVREIPNAELGVIRSTHGHDAFLIEFDQLGDLIETWLNRQQ
ncbi:MAG: homoserine O-acetyltransferase [Candidatus Neomarinimicrobiota bacterium]